MKRNADIIRQYRLGITQGEIARQFHMSKADVLAVIREELDLAEIADIKSRNRERCGLGSSGKRHDETPIAFTGAAAIAFCRPWAEGSQ